MKVVRNDDFNIEVFLGQETFNLDCKDNLEEYLKQFFSRLKKYYNIEIKGFYDIDLYADKNYGIVLDIYKENIDFEPIFNSIDMKITINKCKFLYKLSDYKFEYLGDLYYYNGAYYLDLIKQINEKQLLELIEEVEIIYKDIEVIKKRGQKLKAIM